MSPLDDSLRGAFRDVADEIPADSLPPLVLPPRPRRRPGLTTRGARRPGSHRSRAWIAAASSAVLVAAVIAAAASIAVALNGRQEGNRLPAGASPAQLGQPVATAHANAPAAEDGVPGYYVALVHAGTIAHPSQRDYAVVRATKTGAVLATVTVPRPYDTFTEITGAADDQVWVLSAQELPTNPRQRITTKLIPFEPERLFVLHVDPSARTAAQRTRLTPLPASYLPAGSQTWDMALSPDGTQLAAAVGANTPMMGQGPTKLEMFDLATGSRQTWRRPDQIGFLYGESAEDGYLAWTGDDRRLGFVLPSAGLAEVRMLNTTGPGTRRPTSSRIAFTMPLDFSGSGRQALLTADGKTALAVEEIVKNRPTGRGVNVTQELVKFSVATGKVVDVVNHLRIRGDYEQVLWASPSGSTLVVNRIRSAASADILRDGHDIAIPWSAAIISAAW
jgi:hypothetical protein